MDLDISQMEKNIADLWLKLDLYSFRKQSGDSLFSIDTPPPTVSGSMHMGHAFSYPHQDFVARYKRMRGFRVLYPWGFDDNGLPTERYVEKVTGIRGGKDNVGEFIEKCQEVSSRIEADLMAGWRALGLSADFYDSYRTIDSEVMSISQNRFLDLYESGMAYRKEAPSYRCPTCRTAISQIELKNKEKETDFVDIRFPGEESKDIVISTTRPELLFACVAIAVNPSDERYAGLSGKSFRVPLTDRFVKVIQEDIVEKEKGTGAEMVCTFGDQNDLEIWRKNGLQLRVILGEDGLFNESAGFLKGMTVNAGRRRMIEELRNSGFILGTKKITHTVNVHERCDTPVEIMISRQWFVKCLDLKDDLIKRGREITWKPDFMRIRYENWVNGLKWDWCISRQRFYGIPFPVWYCKDCGSIITAERQRLPIDPRLPGNAPACSECGGKNVVPDTDVMDTWATSSLSPDIAMKHYGLPDEAYPFSCRFQAHDIISTWAFTTILRAHLNHSRIPWREIAVSGNVTDPEGKKLSKSKGNGISPGEIIAKYGADAVRYWSASVSPWEDIGISDQELVRGRRLTVKIYNVSRLLQMLSGDVPVKPGYSSSQPFDQWILSALRNTWSEVTSAMDEYNFYRARLALDTFFWGGFCDNYLEILKGEVRYGGSRESLNVAYSVFLGIIKMYAPLIPFITEEVYQSLPIEDKKASIHLEPWPDFSGLDTEDHGFNVTLEAISKIRSFKSSMKLPLSAEIPELTVSGDAAVLRRDSEMLSRLFRIRKIIVEEATDGVAVRSG